LPHPHRPTYEATILKPVNCIAIAAVLWFAAAGALAQQQVVVVTSFPKELTEAYKKAFEAKNPGIKVEILNKPTPAGVAYIREAPATNKPDVFWVSAPDAFEVLATEKLLAKIESPAKEVPAKIGNYPINDTKGYYLGQALAGYGIMWNTRYMKANKLPDPREWSDLTKPVYFSHVAMSSPSRSGTTHLTVETILQGEGWEKGWRQMLMIAGNCAAITERSFGVPDGVNNGQYGIGLVIDFFGLAGKASKFPVEFVYPSVTAIVPANIGLVANAKNPDNARKFINYTLSPEGQELLFDPAISRLPVLPSAYKKAPPGFPNPFTGSIKPKVNFDADLAESRYYVVSSIFDQTITFRHKELAQAAKAINEAAAKLAGKSNPQALKLLDDARDAAYSPIVTALKSKDKEFLALYRNTKRDAEKTKQTTALEEYWSNTARKNYLRAIDLANQAVALAK
jgi:ABC-type Fe3+ transport system substrate-binding protein